MAHSMPFGFTSYLSPRCMGRMSQNAASGCSLKFRKRTALPSSRSVIASTASSQIILHPESAIRFMGVAVDEDQTTTAEKAADEYLKVLTTWASPFGMRVLVALHEKELRFEYAEETLRSFSPEVIVSNPIHKKVPVFIHNGKAFAESRIILEYIDEQWPASNPNKKGSLLPVSPKDRAHARFWADFIDTKICDVAHDILVKDGEEQGRAIEGTIQNLLLLEKTALGGSCSKAGGGGGGEAMFNGDHLGLTDLCLVGFLQWFRVFEVISSFKLPGRDKCPRLNAWIDAVSEEPSVKRVIPDLQRLVDRARASRCRRGFEDWSRTYV